MIFFKMGSRLCGKIEGLVQLSEGVFAEFLLYVLLDHFLGRTFLDQKVGQ